LIITLKTFTEKWWENLKDIKENQNKIEDYTPAKAIRLLNEVFDELEGKKPEVEIENDDSYEKKQRLIAERRQQRRLGEWK
jgi:hypothetical protein